ncbi:unnamed protein product [Rotaria magnacalcarata]|uniref:Uncharacterized protein n=2 Tax=Rotaria magnacalcarata TaxID=392030 RepID=A0A814FCS3_9BILA|nr:unnamed protein product [Rotaria magnacalcarata]
MNNTEGYESPMEPIIHQQQTPIQKRNQGVDRTTNKRPKSYISSSFQQQTDKNEKTGSVQQHVTHRTANLKIIFSPIVVKFKGNQQQQALIKDITDDLISKWKNQHGIDLTITARLPRSNSPACKRPVPGNSVDFVEAVFRLENFPVISGQFLPESTRTWQESTGKVRPYF